VAVEQRADPARQATGWAKDGGDPRPAFLDSPAEEDFEDFDAPLESLVDLASEVLLLDSPAAAAEKARIVGAFHDGLREGTTRIPNLAGEASLPPLPMEARKPRPRRTSVKEARTKKPKIIGAQGQAGTKPPKKEAEPVADPKPGPLDRIVSAMRGEPTLALRALQELRHGPTRGGAISLDLRQIARRLPVQMLRDLVAEASAGAGEAGPWQPLLTNMWRHTLITARAAELIAPRALRREPGALYTIALLHNVGEFAIVELYRSLEQPPPRKGIATGTLARELVRYHETVGGLLLRRLRLPGILAAVAEDHHHPLEHPKGTAPARYASLIAGCAAATTAAGVVYLKPSEPTRRELAICAQVVGVDAPAILDAAKAAKAEWSQ
jgi:hypothetical protein